MGDTGGTYDGYTLKSLTIVNVTMWVDLFVSPHSFSGEFFWKFNSMFLLLVCSYYYLRSWQNLLRSNKHAFCQFMTGAPRLPPGGMFVLNPKLIINRKVHLLQWCRITSFPWSCYLSFAFFCHSRDRVWNIIAGCCLQKLLYAINQHQGSFGLS
jgi:hypothetical protein